MLASVDVAYRAAMAKLPTPKLTRALIGRGGEAGAAALRAVAAQAALRDQGGSNPPIVVVHGTALSAVPELPPYLEADFRKVFRLEGTPAAGSNSRAAGTLSWTGSI